MNKNKIREAMPTVLFVTGIAGIFVSEIMCARDTLKAEKILEENHIYREKHIIYDQPDENGVEGETVYTPLKEYAPEVIKATWKCYIPTAIATTLTVGALIASNRLTARQVALLSSAVASGGALVQKYRKEILDRTNPEILSEIDKAVAKATMEESKPPIIETSGLMSYEAFDPNEDGEYLFFDPFTKLKFRATKLAVLGAKYYLNRNFSLGGSVGLEMFYNFLGVELPEEYRGCEWDCEVLCNDGYYWIDIDLTRSDDVDPETGERYYIIEYGMDPGECENSYYLYGNPLEMEGSLPIYENK